MPRAALAAGARAVVPMLLGVVPFGTIYGVLAVAAGLPPAAAQAMSLLVFAGSAQFVAVQLIAGGAPAGVVLLTTLVVNLRHVLYSASLAPYLRTLRPAWRWLLAYALVDEVYAVAIARYGAGGPAGQWFALGAGATLWATWQASTAAGIFLGAQVPPGWSLDFTLALTFIALVVPSLRDRAGLAAALVAGAVAVATVGVPLRLGLIMAAAAGILAGLVAEARA